MKSFENLNKMKKIQLFIALILGFAMQGIAQESEQVTLLKTGEQSAGLYFGIDYSFGTMGLQYQRGITLFDRSVIIGADMAFPMFEFDFGDYRVNVIKIQTSVFRKNNFDVTLAYSPTLTKNTNKVQSLTAWGHEVGLRAGFWGNKWGVGGNVTLNKQFATRIEHTDYFKTIVFDEVKDGWYQGTGGNIRLSVEAARRIGQLDVNLKLGLAKTLQFENYLLIPEIYGVVGGTYRF